MFFGEKNNNIDFKEIEVMFPNGITRGDSSRWDSIITNWQKEIMDKVEVHGLHYEYEGDSHDDDFIHGYFLSTESNPFSDIFSKIEPWTSTYDRQEVTFETPAELKTRLWADYCEIFCSFENIPFIINPMFCSIYGQDSETNEVLATIYGAKLCLKSNLNIAELKAFLKKLALKELCVYSQRIKHNLWNFNLRKISKEKCSAAKSNFSNKANDIAEDSLEKFEQNKNIDTLKSTISNKTIDEFDTNYHKRGLTISGGNQNLEVKSINDLIDNIKSNCSIEESSSESTNEVKPKNLFNVISNLYDTKLYKDEYIFYPIFTSQSEIVLPICKYCVSDSSYVIYFGRGMSESEVEKKIFVELEFEKFIKLDIITGKIIEESLIANAKKYVLEDSTLSNLSLFKEFARIRNEILKVNNTQSISKYNNYLALLINNNELIEDLFTERLWTKDIDDNVIDWEPENGINLIDDEILGLALNLANRFSKFFAYRFSRDNRVEIKTGVNICELCENKKTDEYKKLINDFEKQKLWLNLKEKKFSNSIGESIGYCSEDFVSNCPLLVATYIKYLKSTNKLEEKLKEREEYRAKQL